MADLPSPDPMGGADEVPDRASTAGTPRWVKVFGIIAIVLVLLVGFILITGVGGPHGPGRHSPSGDAGGDTPIASVMGELPVPDPGRG